MAAATKRLFLTRDNALCTGVASESGIELAADPLGTLFPAGEEQLIRLFYRVYALGRADLRQEIRAVIETEE